MKPTASVLSQLKTEGLQVRLGTYMRIGVTLLKFSKSNVRSHWLISGHVAMAKSNLI